MKSGWEPFGALGYVGLGPRRAEFLRVGDGPMAWGVRRRPRDRPEPPALEAGGLLSTN